MRTPPQALVALIILALCGSTARGQLPLEVKGLQSDAPLTIAATATPTRLLIDIKMHAGWHLYGKDVGGGQPVSLVLPEGGPFESAGKLVVPETKDGHLTGAFRLELPIRARSRGGALTATFEFMACDPLACLPPMAVGISGMVGEGKPVKVLLAVDAADERSDRITAFLDGHGFSTTVRLFTEARTAECDAHDVVLFDSKLFRKTAKGARKNALAFPKTRTPIVAVGFLGTELIEAHGLAMTSGYI